MSEALLRVRDLKTWFRTTRGEARAVDGVSFDIRKGETFALVGESGCGKSVTALSILRLVQGPSGRIVSGSMLLGETDLAGLPEAGMRRIRGDRISMIFQEPMTSLNPVFTVGFQVEEVLRLHQGMDAAQARRRAVGMLATVGIPDAERRVDDYPFQLSGGQRQRVMIAMAIACKPDLLIADEPTTALDVTIQATILDLIRQLQRETGTSVLLITHDLGVVRENADRIAVMYAGKIVETGPTEEVLRDPRHPYTAQLLESLPAAHAPGERLHAIPGMVPQATGYPEGCRFHDRCQRVLEGCRDIPPALRGVAPGREAACHLHDPEHPKRPLAVAAEPPARPRAASGGRGELLELSGLKVHFPVRAGILKRVVAHVRAVDGVGLAVRRGETLALVGESGCGKTTLGKALLGLAPVTGGVIRYGGTDLGNGAPIMAHRRRLQMVFQDPYSSLNPRMLVREILSEGPRAHGLAAGEDRVAALLGRIGLDAAAADRYPHEFSGGQRQRIGIARALSVEPEFLILDEATSALDISVQAQILNLLSDLQAELGLTFLLITHDLSVVRYLADRVAVMYLGRLVEEGMRDETFGDPRHPYTRALLSAVPRLDPGDAVPKIRLSGSVPSPVRPPPGCPFHPRCPEARPDCASRVPAATRLGPTHAASCLLLEPANLA